MATEPAIVLLFEDDPKIVNDFSKQLRAKLKVGIQLETFPLDAEPPAALLLKPYEDRVEDWLRLCGFQDRIVLIVTDRDLSTNSEKWRGLSQTAVSGAARLFGIPVAGYRRAKKNEVDAIRRIPGDGLIELAADVGRRAEQVASLARGFVDLQQRVSHNATASGPAVKGAKANKRPKAPVATASPGGLLAGVLGHPSTSGHFDTFACGDQVAIGEILTFNEKAKMSVQVQRRLVAALGVWLSDLVMKYPGVLVNRVAAASHLDIDPRDFARDDVQDLFASARYKNLPFEDESSPLWWRHLLDEIVIDEGCATGRELAEHKGLKKIRFCPCSVDPRLHAGFYCMATELPISAEKSSGRVRWFPPGADLARLNSITYKKLAPWLGS